MIVRIRFRQGQRLRKAPGKNRHVALASSALLIPVSLMAYVLGFWRLASDAGLARQFAIRGLFSHWQVWIVVAVSLQIASSVLSRYARGGEFHLPAALTFHFGGTPADHDPRRTLPGVKTS
jgi:hypothetical protein